MYGFFVVCGLFIEPDKERPLRMLDKIVVISSITTIVGLYLLIESYCKCCRRERDVNQAHLVI